MGRDLADLRKEYMMGGLDEKDVDPHPIVQFRRWLKAAIDAGVAEPTAVTLATATRDAVPSARVVLLKDVDEAGFYFYTNYSSKKGRELDENPRASLCFFWPDLERQIRVDGSVERTSRATSDAYFHSRPLSSQIGAWASRQSAPLATRTELEGRVAELERRFAEGGEVPLPDFWGGYLLRPTAIELWQGRPSRLHDRLLYTCTDTGWTITRLSP
jgi:pyridoxamine 5'-phosphate oxidase